MRFFVSDGDGKLPGTMLSSTVHKVCRKFSRDRSGSIAIVFAMTFTMVIALVGGAVDYARWLSAKSQTVRAMDAAVLAGGRQLLLNKTVDEAIAAAQQFYNQNKSNLLSSDAVTFSVNSSGTIMEGVSNSAVKTPLLAFAGVPSLSVRETASALIETGANAGQSIEIAVMLDTTGSMAGSKMVALKQAAIDLVNIVVWDDQSEFTSRVAIVPFAPYVNPGRDAFELATNYSPSGNSDNRTCVKERQGTNRYTDETPNAANGYFNYYTSNSACKPQATILPLSNNIQKLEQRINEMQPTGATAGHLGTAWAWYALSPNFASLWPADSQPAAYSQLTELNDQHQPKLQKIAILMTDGEYNTKYSGNSSATQARETCAAMKNKGLIIYTIGFGISAGGEADTTLSQCATSGDYYYNASSGDALRSAFRDIALKIATLRLTQ